MMMGKAILAAAMMLLATAAIAQDAAPTETVPASIVPTEAGENGTSTVTLHLHPFLTPEELAVLRLVLTNDEALGLFVPERTGFAALAVSPEDGFVREAVVVPSAQALGEMPDADLARTAALAACDALRKGTSPCVVVLDISTRQ